MSDHKEIIGIDEHRYVDTYLRSYPVKVMQPRAMVMLNVDSGGPPAPPLEPNRIVRTERILRLLTLLQSSDPRQRKRGTRLATDALKRKK
jgi:hypothetical protein